MIGNDGAKNKKAFIKASKVTIKRYKRWQFGLQRCAFCIIVDRKSSFNSCEICPMAVKGGTGCVRFSSYKELQHTTTQHAFLNIDTVMAFDRRIDFHENYLIPLIESLPDSQFTINGFKYIEHDWNR